MPSRKTKKDKRATEKIPLAPLVNPVSRRHIDYRYPTARSHITLVENTPSQFSIDIDALYGASSDSLVDTWDQYRIEEYDVTIVSWNNSATTDMVAIDCHPNYDLTVATTWEEMLRAAGRRRVLLNSHTWSPVTVARVKKPRWQITADTFGLNKFQYDWLGLLGGHNLDKWHGYVLSSDKPVVLEVDIKAKVAFIGRQ